MKSETAEFHPRTTDDEAVKQQKKKPLFHSYAVISYSDFSYFCSLIKQKTGALYLRLINLMSDIDLFRVLEANMDDSIKFSDIFLIPSTQLAGLQRSQAVFRGAASLHVAHRRNRRWCSLLFLTLNKSSSKRPDHQNQDTDQKSRELGNEAFIQPQLSFDLLLMTRGNKKEEASKRNDGADK